MKIVFLLIITVSAHITCFSQINLVPNPSFEIYDTCPFEPINPLYSGVSAICRATPWFQPNNPNPINCGGSTDFFHACNNSVPKNINGFQYARTGLGYAGAWMIFNPEGGGGSIFRFHLLLV